MKKRWWAYYDLANPSVVLLLDHRKLTDKQVRSKFNELPRYTGSQGIIPFVIGLNYLSKEQMDAITGSIGGVIP
jgi:hypothetical protein